MLTKIRIYGQAQVISDKIPRVIAFGSCNFQFHRQDYWETVLVNEPELWIWLGDIIYADTRDTAVLRRKYEQQMNKPVYRDFVSRVPVIGTWDDHDMGVNDADRYYEHKALAKTFFWNLMGVGQESPLRRRDGVYSSWLMGPTEKQVKIIITDLRYLKQKPGADSSMLGEEQWVWLEKELLESEARLNIIGSSIQFLSRKKLAENWAEFPSDQKRMWKLLEKQGKYNTIFISGDIHSAELLGAPYPNDKGRFLYEFTSSGLTHSNWFFPFEENRYSLETDYYGRNFGIIRLDFEPRLEVSLEVRNPKNKSVRKLKLLETSQGFVVLE